MNLNITGHHVDLTDPLRDYVTEKMKKVERHFDHLIDAHVVLTVEKLEHKAEATLHASGADLHAAASTGDMYSAIDQLIDKLDRQTRKHKELVRDHHAKEAQKGIHLQ
jgi:putative sigma-54 modulation protein